MNAFKLVNNDRWSETPGVIGLKYTLQVLKWVYLSLPQASLYNIQNM